MSIARLVPGGFYWARSGNHFDGRPTVVQISDVFGDAPEFWTLALLGSDQHAMLGEFEIIEQIHGLHLSLVRVAAQ
jgi:hypothetical protein